MKEIINLLEKNQELIISQISQEGIDVSVFIQKEYNKLGSELLKDSIFRYIFKKYYLSSSARFFSEKSYNIYFSIFSELVVEDYVNTDKIIKEVLRGLTPMREKLEYSYASKMIHTVNTNYPLYDSYVKSALRLKNISGKSNEERIESYLIIYKKIIEIYNKIIKNESLKNLIKNFEEQRKLNDINDIKILDFLFWGTGKLINDKMISF